MTPEAMAALHARVFPGRKGWTARDFTEVLENPGALLATTDHGFALGRAALDEAELLLIITNPAHRRQGQGSRLLGDLEETARKKGARSLFLEVAESNVAARALYASRRYEEIARRKDYYPRPDGTREDALILSRWLTAP